MRKLLLMVVFSLFAIAGYYPSIHQLANTKGLINELKELVQTGRADINKVYMNIQDDASHYKDTWCGRKFNRVKIYIPPGLKQIKVYVVMRPNSSIFALRKFIPEGQPVESIIDWTKLENDYRYLYTTRQKDIIDVAPIFSWWHGYEKYFKDVDTFKGGWLYVQLIQASEFLDSDFGHIPSPSAQLVVEYKYDPKYKPILDEWLKNIKFNPNGDPVDRFDTIEEKVRYCSDFGKAEKIRGIKDSDITGYELFYGIDPDPNAPRYTIEANKASIQRGESVTLTSTLTTREASLDGISVEINQNTTTGVLLENHIDSSCAMFAQANGEDDHTQGKLIYSDNGANWYDNPNDEAIADNIRYIGYLLTGSYPKASKAKLSVKFNISSGCSESLKDTSTLRYMMDGEEKSIQKSLTLPYGVASSSSSSKSTLSTSGGYGGGGYSGGGSGTIPSGTDNGWNGYGSTIDESNHEQELCQEQGGRWVDNVCLDASASSSTSSSYSSQQSSWSSTATQNDNESSYEQELCQARGGRWVDNVCLDARMSSSTSSSSSSTQSSVSSAKSEKSSIDVEEIITTLAQKDYPINGYFVHYGSGPFDWLYYSQNTGGIYKLDGMRSDGYFKWTPLTQYFDGIEVKNGDMIKIGEALIDQELQKKKEACENILHGQWVQDNSRWMCVIEGHTSSKSSLSSSSSSSFSSSSSSSYSSSSVSKSSSSSSESESSSSSMMSNSDKSIGAFPSTKWD